MFWDFINIFLNLTKLNLNDVFKVSFRPLDTTGFFKHSVVRYEKSVGLGLQIVRSDDVKIKEVTQGYRWASCVEFSCLHFRK